MFRFFFDDFESFKYEAGLNTELDRALWGLGWFRTHYLFTYKLLGIFGALAAVAAAVYQCLVLVIT